MNLLMLYSGAGLTAAWGIAHLFPTRSVVRGFGELSADNRRIIAMEWIVEGVALIFIGLLVGLVTFVDPHGAGSRAACLLAVFVLIALALVSLFTGFRIRFLPFRLCPFIFTLSAVLILAGTLV